MAKHVTSPLWGLNSIWTMNPESPVHGLNERLLSAGAIIGSGTVSNRDRSRSSCCIAERRTIETIEAGKPSTPFLRVGDRVRIEMLDRGGRSLFGAIDQEVTNEA